MAKRDPKLKVTIQRRGNQIVGVTEGKLSCIIVGANKEHCLVGDRWTAKAVEGRVLGSPGRSKIELLERPGLPSTCKRCKSG